MWDVLRLLHPHRELNFLPRIQRAERAPLDAATEHFCDCLPRRVNDVFRKLPRMTG